MEVMKERGQNAAKPVFLVGQVLVPSRPSPRSLLSLKLLFGWLADWLTWMQNDWRRLFLDCALYVPIWKSTHELPLSASVLLFLGLVGIAETTLNGVMLILMLLCICEAQIIT